MRYRNGIFIFANVYTVLFRLELCGPSLPNLKVTEKAETMLRSKALKKFAPSSLFRSAWFALIVGLAPAAAFANVDLVVNNTDSPDPVAAGGVVTYTVRVTNDLTASESATGVSTSHAISAGTIYQGVTGPGVNCSGMTIGQSGPGTLTCTLPNLTIGGESIFSIKLKSSTVGNISLGAEATSLQTDSAPGNNILVESTTVNAGADLAINVTPAVSTASSGAIVSLNLDVSNSGPNAATNLVVSTPVPTGFNVVSVPAGCSNSAGTITCTIAGPIAAGGNLSIGTITGQIIAAGGSTVTSTTSVQVSGTAPPGTPQDPDTSNNTAIANITVTTGSDLKIAKARSVGGNLLVGQAFNFTLTPTYSGDVPTTLTVTDTIPANYTVGTVVTPQNGWSCNVAGQTVTCTRANGGGSAGLNQAIGVITIPVTATTPGSPTNSTTIGAATNDPNPANNTATDGGVTILAPTVNLGVAKAGPTPALVVAGVPFNYNITANNTGTTGYVGTMTVTDTLPAGLTVNSYTLNGWSCSPAAPVVGGASIACTRTYLSGAPLPPNETTPAAILNVTATATGNINNSVKITADCNLGAGNCGDGDIASYAVTSSVNTASADIRLLKTVIGPDPVPAGDELTYKLEIVNVGPTTSNNVALTDTLDDLINNTVGATGAGYVGHTISAGVATGATCSTATAGGTGRRLTCDFGTIPVCTPGANCPVITVKVRPGGNGGARKNTAIAVSNDTADPNHVNDQAEATSNVDPRADVTVTKNANPGTIAAGQPLTYLITASNAANGLSAADNVTITDTLPLGVTFASASPSSGSCSVTPGANATTTGGNRTVTCNLGTVNNGSQKTVSIVVRPNNITRGTTITNNVTVSTTTTETNAANNTASATADVVAPRLDLVLNKVDTADPVAVGDPTSYTISVTNSGPSAAENVIVNDPLPTDGKMSFQSINTTAGSCATQPALDASGGLVSCNFGYMPAGTTQTVTINMKGLAKGIYTNTASVTSDEVTAGFDFNVANNTDGETTTVRTKADMEVVSKLPSAGTVNLRDNFNYIIKVRNNGPNEADDVKVTDNLPAGMELTGTPTVSVISGNAPVTSCTGTAGATTFVCDLGTVSNGAVLDIMVPVQLVSVTAVGVAQTFTNTATVTTSSLDNVPGNNTKTGDVTVNASTIAGRVFSDINNDGLVSAGDTGIAGVTMTLTGTTFDGVTITPRTVVTDASGNYLFSGVPQGTYQIAEGTVTAKHFVDGKDTAGSVLGDATSVNDRISNIVLPANTAATAYNFAEVPVPLIGVAKVAGAVVNNLDGTYDVPFTLTVTNAGKTALSSVQITDTVAGQFGTFTAGTPAAGQYTITGAPTVSSQTNGAAITAVGAGVFTGSGGANGLLVPASSSLPNFGTGTASTAQVKFTVRFFPTTAGPFNNTAIATGTSPTSAVVTDNSVDGAVPDANGDDDPTNDNSPTIVNLAGQAIGVAKSVGTIQQTGPKRFRIPYTIVVQNVSTSVTATNVQVIDNLKTTFPTAQTITISSVPVISACTGTVLTVAAPVFNGITQNNLLAGNQNLQHGEKCTINFTTEIDFGANALPAVVQNNQATATTAQTPGGTVIATDLSNNGATIDPNSNANAGEGGENVPTPVSFAAADMSAVKGTVYLDRNHDRADNDGSPAPNVAGFIVEVLNSTGEIVGTATTAVDGTYTVEGLRPSTPGDPSTYFTVHFIEPASHAVYGISQSSDPTPARNGVVVNGEITQLQLAAGVTTTNQNLPLDPSGVVYDSISRNPVAGASVTITSGGTPVPAGCLVGGNNTELTGITGMYQFLLINPVPPGCPTGNQPFTLAVTAPAGYLPPPSSMIPPNAGAYTPTNGGVDPIQAQVGAPSGGQPTIYYLSFNLTPGVSSNVVNNHIPLDPILGGAIVMTKSTPLVNVVRSDLVPYTITATNTLAATLSNISIVDTIPAGFRYRTGSASLNNVHLEPVVTGRSLTWPNQTFTPNERKSLRMILVVGTGVSEGEYVNQVAARNSLVNSQVSNTATATVRVVPDPTFDCSDIIGKVFDDKNANGYQDQDEPGIANVRIATPRGLLVTSDHDGRFHVACAEIPNEARGSNFVMKVDERTLPTGYRLTTENPRDVRVTRGKMTKLNFGATVHRVIRLELSGAAFNGDSTELQASYLSEFEKLPEQLQERPSVLRIAYRRGVESADLARKRVATVRERIEDLWHKKRRKDENGDTVPVNPLLIETEIEVAQ